jgi:hypothetical protein
MADVEGARNFGITSEALWVVVADRTRRAEWVPTMRRAEPAGTEEVYLEGESHGHPYSLASSGADSLPGRIVSRGPPAGR